MQIYRRLGRGRGEGATTARRRAHTHAGKRSTVTTDAGNGAAEHASAGPGPCTGWRRPAAASATFRTQGVAVSLFQFLGQKSDSLNEVTDFNLEPVPSMAPEQRFVSTANHVGLVNDVEALEDLVTH